MTFKRVPRIFLVVASISALAAVSGCGGKSKPNEQPVPNAAVDDTNPIDTAGGSDMGKAGGLVTVHFPYDSFVLDSETKGQLKSNADILKQHSGWKIQVEGHCDQRGGIQYNIALGEKRANSVKKYLEDLGISDARLTTISFGKERPIDPGTTEEAYAKNRRANFQITSTK